MHDAGDAGAFCKRRLVPGPDGTAQPAFGAFLVVNINEQTVPSGNVTVGIPQRERAPVEPAVYAVGSAQTLLHLIWLSGFDRVLPRSHDAWQVIRMHRLGHRPIPQLVKGPTEVFQDLPIDQFDVASRRHRIDEAGN